ncbi:MAG: surface lipoprotein assembly modifier [Rhodocyclaceae bacterium]|nr:surface lipoprotein assembly modifier [Rhodocyclaceae bacterium]
MKTKSIRRISLVVAAAFALQVSSAFADELTDKAKVLLNAGKGGDAFGLLEPAESVRAGEPEYDFLLGLAAMEAGQNTRAVFALERVLAVEPNNTRARAEIARAYLALGETQTAQQEFETVKRQGVPADVSMTIDRYIASIRRAEDQNQPSVTGYVEASLGYDTNVNIGPNRNSVAIPGFGNLPFELSKDSKANEDGFGALGAGVNLRTPIGGGYTLLAGLSGSSRGNFSKQQFDTYSGDLNVGVSRSAEQDVYTLMAQTGVHYVDDSRYRNYNGITGQWQRNLDARNQVGAFAQYSDLQYAEQDVRDAHRWVAGASFAHLYREGIMAFASAYFVAERPQHGHVGWLGFDGMGLRAGGRMNLDSQTVLFGGATFEYRSYNKEDPSFLNKRRDNQIGVLLGATRYLNKEWSVTPQLSLTYNESNTELNEYHRELVSVTIRREF